MPGGDGQVDAALPDLLPWHDVSCNGQRPCHCVAISAGIHYEDWCEKCGPRVFCDYAGDAVCYVRTWPTFKCIGSSYECTCKE